MTGAERVEVRFAPVLSRDTFDPADWRHEDLTPHPDVSDWYRIDIDDLDLEDGRYEYEFLAYRDGDEPDVAPDPFAAEITRFQGHRGTFRIRDGTGRSSAPRSTGATSSRRGSACRATTSS